jgi:hypothetical protein
MKVSHMVRNFWEFFSTHDGEILRLVWNSKFHYRVYIIPPLVRTLKHINSFCIPLSHFFEIDRSFSRLTSESSWFYSSIKLKNIPLLLADPENQVNVVTCVVLYLIRIWNWLFLNCPKVEHMQQFSVSVEENQPFNIFSQCIMRKTHRSALKSTNSDRMWNVVIVN